MVNTLRVMLWDEEIGRLAWDANIKLVAICDQFIYFSDTY